MKVNVNMKTLRLCLFFTLLATLFPIRLASIGVDLLWDALVNLSEEYR